MTTERLPSDSDAFEKFNRAQGMGTVRDAYAIFAALRDLGPVVRIEPGALLGGSGGSAAESEEVSGPVPDMAQRFSEIFTAVSFDAVSEVLRDARRFSSAGYSEVMGPVMGHTILEMDPPEHGRYRGLLNSGFTRRALDRWDRDLVRPVIHGLIDRFADRGRADLVRELTFPFPVSVIAGMIGLPESDHADFHRWAIELISVGIDPEAGHAASKNLHDLFSRVLAERRAEPRDDLLSALARARFEGHALEDEAIIAFLRLLAPAGAETTYRSSSNLVYGLLSHRDQWELLLREPDRMDAAIEEGLRWECPLTGIMRTCTEDTEVCGVAIPAGGLVHVNLAAANRDPDRWEEPDRFDITRAPRQHMAFAFGPHRCLGQHLARIETRALLEAVIERLPNLRLDPAAEDVHVTGLVFRTPLELPVCFDASS
jgi:cytochrome P450